MNVKQKNLINSLKLQPLIVVIRLESNFFNIPYKSDKLLLNINYSMSPFFNKEIHLKAIEYNQLVIPGISNIEDFKEALNLGYKIIKVFPASKLGINFLKKLKDFKENDIFFIGAGGIKTEDLNIMLNNGYNALVIGKELKNQTPNQSLEIWLKTFQEYSSKDYSS